MEKICSQRGWGGGGGAKGKKLLPEGATLKGKNLLPDGATLNGKYLLPGEKNSFPLRVAPILKVKRGRMRIF